MTVHGGLDPVASSGVRERIAAVAGRKPQRLVLDLVPVGDRFHAESLALIAVARHVLPSGCALEVRSASPAVRQVLRLAGWGGPESGTGDDETGSGGNSH
jgi:hypothetical protein